MAAQVGAIQDQQQSIGLGDAGHVAGQDIAGDLFVFRARVQAVDAGQINQHHVVLIRSVHLRFADALLHRDAREVGHLLTQARQPIKERRFARIWRTDDRHDVCPRALLERRRGFRNRTAGASVAIAHCLTFAPLISLLEA